MTSSDDSPRDPVDPDFAGLFRADDGPALDVVEPAEEPAPVFDPEADHESPVPEADPESPEPEAPVAPAADPVADTGRIFRSQGVIGHDDAVLAIANDRRLRTLERRSDVEPAPMVAPAAVATALADDASPVHQVIPAAADPHGVEPAAPSDHSAAESPVTGPTRSRIHRSRSITAGAVYIVVIGVTVLVGFVNAFLSSGDLGWPTGIALVASSVYAALTVRREDDTAAIIIPPVAFLIAALTAGQAFVGALEGALLNRVVVVFFTLADNWVWIIGATVAALAIVLVRRRRG